MSDLEKVAKIVELRKCGKTWAEIEEQMFPDSKYRTTGKGNRDSWNLCAKHKAAAEGAYTKKVIGCWGPTQIVVKLRDRVVSQLQESLSYEELLQNVKAAYTN